MTTRTVGPNRFVAAASAVVITAVSAWAFVSSTTSIDRDPFHFAAVMSANARVRVAQLNTRTAAICPNNPEARDHRAPTCLSG